MQPIPMGLASDMRDPPLESTRTAREAVARSRLPTIRKGEVGWSEDRHFKAPRVPDQAPGQRGVLDRRVEQMSSEQHPETAILRQVQVVGPNLALAYVATLEDPERFASSRTVGNYVGLAPGQYASGAKTPQLRISKRGDRLLRRLLVNSASYILGPFGQDSDLRRYGERIAWGGSQRDRARARIAVARKLACVLHHLWRTGSVWEPLHAS